MKKAEEYIKQINDKLGLCLSDARINILASVVKEAQEEAIYEAVNAVTVHCSKYTLPNYDEITIRNNILKLKEEI